MDPLTLTTSIMTLASFINELIEVGENICRSIEKVNKNRRHIRDLTNEVVKILYDLDKLTRGHEDVFRGPELLKRCSTFILNAVKSPPPQSPSLCGVRSQFKAWRKHDDLEVKFGYLKEHVSKCFSQFTAFSAARIEQNTLRIEQTLIVNNVENQVKARRLEGMMAQILFETQFGQNMMDRTVETILADSTRSSLESQYISAQTMCLITSLEGLLISGKLVLNGPLVGPTQAPEFTFRQCTPLHLLHEILGVVIDINESRYNGILLGNMEGSLLANNHHVLWIGVSEIFFETWGIAHVVVLSLLDTSYTMAANGSKSKTNPGRGRGKIEHAGGTEGEAGSHDTLVPGCGKNLPDEDKGAVITDEY
ncbi:hypothetical protein B0H14DRAFT_2560806 [Mycena olivaceomarginata]|nr:hypothetical protein B0H14DRAFT_2560806 [Mycena olivaceomarginata]